MEPLDGAQVVVATNHLVVGDLVAQEVSWIVRINLYIGQLVRAVSALLVTAIGFLGCGFFLLHSLKVFCLP